MAELGQLELHVRGQTGQVFHLDVATAEGYIIGRSDPVNSNYLPDIDLNECDAAEHGVSRRHAAVVSFNNNVCLVDLNSSNGTFINGEKLRADSPQILRDEDELRFGTLFVYVSFAPSLPSAKIHNSQN